MQSLKKHSHRPWLCGGDFNEILSQQEKLGGPPRPNWQIRNFRSDHLPILVKLSQQPRFSGKGFRPLRFEASWLQSKNCEEAVRQSWHDSVFLEGPNRIISRLDACIKNLKAWSEREFKRDKELVNKLEHRLYILSSENISEGQKEEAMEIREELERLAAHEESFWKQHNKALWLKEEDRNTRFFHQKASHSFRSNLITKLKSSNGVWVDKEKEIQHCIISHFEDVFSSSHPRPDDVAHGTEH
ncbi:UNVERIFIED_CONTAM: hypothetical protein Slati_3848900 [Sesamum latifolium]|uniref:Endonuclease/exonuclease/phosphatase n=1 Tax=Sesamum latifolium TaxID=2727402 RepID=A0AAW2TKL0_9LAMI